MNRKDLKKKLDNLYMRLEDIETNIDAETRKIRETYDDIFNLSDELDSPVTEGDEDEGDSKET